MHTLLKNGVFLTGDHREVVQGDLRIESGIITEMGPGLRPGDARVRELSGGWVMPGFVQTHIHLCQTLFRGSADDLALLDWLRTRIWPLEAAHDQESMYWSARLGVTELLLGGTTQILDMGSVHHTDSLFMACEEAGIRAHIGRAMMDRENEAGLSQSMDESLRGACDEADRWHQRGRLRYAFAPRFVPSCSDQLLREVAREARRRGCLIHTHASENTDEVAWVRELTGRDNIIHLHELGLSGPDVCLAHCIHLSEEEIAVLASTETRVLHCPSSNLKLASGVARVPELLEQGVHVSLGADGAPCNNRLDMFTELRTAALLQKPRLGAQVLPAAEAFQLATRAGAEALGAGGRLGQLACGFEADLVFLNQDDWRALPSSSPLTAVVYALDPASVQEVWIAGEPVVRDGRVLAWESSETVRGVREAFSRVWERAGL